MADEIKGNIIRHRKRNNLTYTMGSKLATALGILKLLQLILLEHQFHTH